MPNATFSSRQYSKRRDELLNLLQQAIDLHIPEKYDSELRETIRKCKENQFEIALVGEFQGGKSTTFNALCDGRDISPRGLGGGGIKTSAAVISAQNIAGDEAKNGMTEWAEIRFREKAEITLGMAQLLKPKLRENKEFRSIWHKMPDDRFDNSMLLDDTFPQMVDLDNPKVLAILKKVINSLWATWNANKASFSDDELDQLRIATLQTKYYGTDEYKRLQKKNILGIYGFQQLIQFPRDWSPSWTNGKDTVFEFEEVAFVFIARVTVRLHSENLERLGCRVTDCPGLFVNAYDTKVAKGVIQNADAVWYLINGDKQIGDADLKIIREIASMGMLDKIDASCNLRGDHAQKIEQIFPSTKAILENAGFSVGLFPYNARLAFLAMQGKLLATTPEKFSSHDEKCMKIDAKAQDDSPLEKHWCRMIRRQGIITGVEILEDIDELSEENATIVRNESLMDDVLDKLERDVIHKKAKSILVDKGSHRATEALRQYEGTLKTVEDAAQKDVEKWRQERDEAKKALNQFIEDSQKLLEKSALEEDANDFAQRISDEFVDSVLDDQFIVELAQKYYLILDNISFQPFLTKKKLEKELKNQLGAALMECYNNAVIRIAEKWRTNLNSTKSLKKLKYKIDVLKNEISDLWKEIEPIPIFAGMNWNAMIDNVITEHCGRLQTIVLDSAELRQLADEVRSGFWMSLVGILLALPFAAFAKLWEKVSGKDILETDIKEENAKIKEIHNQMKKALNDIELRKSLQGDFQKSFSNMIKKIRQKIDDSLEKLRNDFQTERCDKPEKMFSETEVNRQKIAAQNKEIRTKKIVPLRKQLEVFERAVLTGLSQ